MTERIAYQEEVTPGALPHAMRGYNALGYPPAGYMPGANGMMVIIIMAPPQTVIPDWRSGLQQPSAPRPRQLWPAWDAQRVVQWAMVLAVIAGALYIGSALFGGGDAPAPAATAQTDDAGPLSWLRLPWQTDDAPAQVAEPQAEPFRWPWERAADAVGEVVADAQATMTAIAYGVLGVLVLLIVLALVAKRR